MNQQMLDQQEELKIIVLSEIDQCDVCGNRMHIKFIRPWNGKDVCRSCIHELNKDV